MDELRIAGRVAKSVLGKEMTIDDLSPAEQAVARKMMEKGYGYIVQVTTEHGEFGEPLYFKSAAEVGPFLRSFPDYKNAKMKWVVKLQ